MISIAIIIGIGWLVTNKAISRHWIYYFNTTTTIFILTLLALAIRDTNQNLIILKNKLDRHCSTKEHIAEPVIFMDNGAISEHIEKLDELNRAANFINTSDQMSTDEFAAGADLLKRLNDEVSAEKGKEPGLFEQ